MEAKSTIFVGRDMVKIQKEFMTEALDLLPNNAAACLTSEPEVDAYGSIGYDPHLVIQRFLNLREHRKQKINNPDPLILVADLNFHTLPVDFRNQLIEVMVDKVNSTNTHVWINVSFLSAGLNTVFRSVPQICGFHCDRQTSVAICGDDRLFDLKDSDNPLLIQRLTTSLRITELKIPKLKSSHSSTSCVCVSRDLFHYGCRCGFLKKNP